MKTREFRVEFLREIANEEQYFPPGANGTRFVAMINQSYDHEGGKEDCEIVFRSKDNGKYYSFSYYFNNDVGINCFEGVSDDEKILCSMVEKKEVTTTTWVRV